VSGLCLESNARYAFSALALATISLPTPRLFCSDDEPKRAVASRKPERRKDMTVFEARKPFEALPEGADGTESIPEIAQIEMVHVMAGAMASSQHSTAQLTTRFGSRS
jgi:hypothetical protein